MRYRIGWKFLLDSKMINLPRCILSCPLITWLVRMHKSADIVQSNNLYTILKYLGSNYFLLVSSKRINKTSTA